MCPPGASCSPPSAAGASVPAKAAGVDTRQIRRYEAGRQQPVLSVAVAIAKALGISVSELAGTPSHRVSLTGDWWTCWQTSRGGVEDIRTQPVHLDQHGELIQIEATARGRSVEEGGYLWRGELRLWDNELLMGWYAANDGSVRSKGTMYFVLHPPRHQRHRPMGRAQLRRQHHHWLEQHGPDRSRG
jgi:transcriptional regulator with XRE-family HTH domain